MALWGGSDADEAKPKWLTTEEKRAVYATNRGWVKADASGTGEEVLVAIRGLSTRTSTGGDVTGLNVADVSSINWNITTFDKSAGGTLSVTVNYNEQVDVTGTPQLTVVNDQRANHTLSYASGTATNRLTFTLVIGAANAATNAGDVLSIGANAMSLNGGTVKEKGTSANATITNAAGIGTGAGTITVVA
tara:strand:- start:2367 stop:2936 length:570 start_codon:yes stop_codon:yes gene_type:complete